MSKEAMLTAEVAVLTELVRVLSDKVNELEAKQEQGEPVAMQMDVIVGNLVREGINKHRARELAEHFIKHTKPQPSQKPLTDEQIEKIRQQPQHHKGEFDYEFNELSFARAIEAAHGIKE